MDVGSGLECLIWKVPELVLSCQTHFIALRAVQDPLRSSQMKLTQYLSKMPRSTLSMQMRLGAERCMGTLMYHVFLFFHRCYCFLTLSCSLQCVNLTIHKLNISGNITSDNCDLFTLTSGIAYGLDVIGNWDMTGLTLGNTETTMRPCWLQQVTVFGSLVM